MVLPKKFRQDLSDREAIILSRGLEGCIWGFSLEDFEKEAEKQLAVTLTEQRGRDLRRYLFSAAENVRLDEQGRFVIPKMLLEYAGIKNEVVIIGAGDHLEIWDTLIWQKLIENLTKENHENIQNSSEN